MGRQTDISNCKPTENGSCIISDQCNDIATFMIDNNATCSWFTYEENVPLPVTINKPSSIKVWGFGLMSVGIISLSGLFGGLFWPLINSKLYKYMMHILIGLAVGSLSATSLFQLIPEGFEIKSTNEGYLNIALFIWGSIWTLYMLQVLSRIAFHKKNKIQKKIINDTSLEYQAADGLLSTAAKSENSPSISTVDEPSAHNDDKKTIAYMIIFGDALHNFIDGMSIGAAYSQDLSAGLGISIAIACEEFPHEL
ncbi:hypothetical protein L9F63_011121, partial [Diploptera punctata]